MARLDDFISLIDQSIVKGEYETKKVGNSRWYFDSDYKDALKAIYDSRCEYASKEFRTVKGHKDAYKICSVSSSARLCFLYFYKKDATFEIGLPNPTGSGNPAQPDAKRIENGKIIYYECKCQEVVNGEKEVLPPAYLKLLADEFGLQELKIKKIIVKDKEIEAIDLNLKQMGCSLNKSYDDAHFNVKQLFTHLLAIKDKHKEEEVELRYVIFKPKQELLNKKPTLLKVYEELDKEIEEIWSSDAIKFFLNKHKNIKLGDKNNIYVYVDDKEMMVL